MRYRFFTIPIHGGEAAEAERDGVPPYAVFTNEQLAAIVQGRMTMATALKAIDGIGDARIDKYAAPVPAIMTAANGTGERVEA